jgi:hypothetical protein
MVVFVRILIRFLGPFVSLTGWLQCGRAMVEGNTSLLECDHQMSQQGDWSRRACCTSGLLHQ